MSSRSAELLVAEAERWEAITNGEPDGDRHPYVGLAVFDDAEGPSHRCSASRLSPTVVLTAGHCTDGAVAARVWFDEDVQSNSEYPFSGATSVVSDYAELPERAWSMTYPARRRLPGRLRGPGADRWWWAAGMGRAQGPADGSGPAGLGLVHP